jgi:hypothetical protein
MLETHHVYGLLCPVSNKVRYVGRSQHVTERYRQHVTLLGISPDGPRTPRERWITELKSQGLAPELVILETIEGEGIAATGGRAKEAERAWVRRLLDAGHPLTNSGHERAPGSERLIRTAQERGRALIASLAS